ncbi:hypothetical protein TIFTF001_017261 [Ficus carica]|uniref:Uncharacterized protein n=1 Tax=Ficus carica TaxID=3494 RepID=A0AA88DJ00_FICCA|nr:hypothetical protein TIFTF001_017261 [Ficus carica]
MKSATGIAGDLAVGGRCLLLVELRRHCEITIARLLHENEISPESQPHS